MHNYMAADLNRIFKRNSRVTLMLVTFAVFCAAIAIYVSVIDVMTDPAFKEAGIIVEKNPNTVSDAIRTIASYAVGIIGLFELIFVFSDDIKAKTAQIAIGVGVSRAKVVLGKFFEMMILLVVDLVVMVALGMVMSVVMGSMLTVAQALQFAKELSASLVLCNMAYASLVFILMFTTQSTTQSIICFLALNFGVVNNVAGLLDRIPALESLNLSSYTLTNMLNQIKGMTTGAAFQMKPFAIALTYIVVALGLTMLLYRKKELEF